MTEREALKLALKALEAAYARLVTKCEQNLVTYNGVDVDTLTLSQEAITAIKEALAQPEQLMHDQINYGMSVTQGGKRIDPMSIYKEPEQEPVAWMLGHRVYDSLAEAETDWEYNPTFENTGYVPTPLYTSPPQRKPLTDEEIEELRDKHLYSVQGVIQGHEAFARAIEAAHGIKERQ